MRTAAPPVRRRHRRQHDRGGASVELVRDDRGSTPRRRPERASFHGERSGAGRALGAKLRRRDGDRRRRGGDRKRLRGRRRRDVDVLDVVGRVVADLKHQHRDQRHHQTRREAAPGARATRHAVKSCIPPVSSPRLLLHGNCYAVNTAGHAEREKLLNSGASRAAPCGIRVADLRHVSSPRSLSSEERYMLRGEPVGVACLSGNRRGGAAGLEGRARFAPTMQPTNNSTSEPEALARTRAAYGIPASPVGTTPPTTPSPISPIAALTDAIAALMAHLPPRDMASAMPALQCAGRLRDVREMNEVAGRCAAGRCSNYTVFLTSCG